MFIPMSVHFTLNQALSTGIIIGIGQKKLQDYFVKNILSIPKKINVWAGIYENHKNSFEQNLFYCE